MLSAATRLFLDEGVGVSTASIARAAGVSNGTLFNAFPTKQILIDTIYKDAKSSMFASLPHSGEAAFDRVHLRENWDAYLEWARSNPQRRLVMHLLLDAGLASAETQSEIDEFARPNVAWLERALDKGTIRAPSVTFIGRLIFFHLDLVINERLDRTDEDLAFEMLCQSIGLAE